MPVSDEIAEYDIDASTGFILAEEAALKKFLSGITIPRRSSTGRTEVEVPVMFRWPAGERKITYPYIQIDLLNVIPDAERQTSVWNMAANPSVFFDPLRSEADGGPYRVGQYYPSVSPDSMPHLGDNSYDYGYRMENPKPVKLMYQVTVYSRNGLDDRMLMSKFFTDVFPPRPLWLSVAADHTWRRMDLVSFSPADSQETTETDKQIRRKIYTISIEAEIPVESVSEVFKARRVHVDLYGEDTSAREAVSHLATDQHDTAIGNFTVAPPEETP